MPQLFEYDDLEKNFKLAKRLGLDFIELNLNFASCREALEKNKVLDLVNKYQVETTLHFFDEADFGSYQEVVDAYLSYFDNYARLGKDFIKQINIHLNPGPVVTIAGIKHYVYEKEYDQYIARLIKNLKEAKDICDKYGINLVIENVEFMPSYTKKTYKDLFDNDFRFCYDIGHDHLSDDLLLNIIKETHLPFDEFHFHDAKDRNKCHLSLKTGTLNLPLYKRLAESNNAYVVLEVKQEKDVIDSIKTFKKL